MDQAQNSRSLSLVFTLSEGANELIKVLTVFQELGISLKHIESRPSKNETPQTKAVAKYDYFVDCAFSKLPATLPEQQHKVDEFVQQLKEISSCVTVHPPANTPTPNGRPEATGSKTTETKEEVPWFPKSIAELDKCCTQLHRFGHELTPTHPGYGDAVYEERRKFIAEIAYNYKYGDSIPRVEYNEIEKKTWETVFTRQTALYPTHACKEYNKQYPPLFEACGYRADNIPQLEDVSRYLRARTGWQLWPVVGWISPRNFLASLAFRAFPTSQFIRHHSSPFYTPEPDICHELMGHVPLFCDPTFAQFSQEIGLASLGLPDEWIEKMSTLYWFTVEFGLCLEDGKPKAYGAGILSSNAEINNFVSDKVERRELDISNAMVQAYPDESIQPLYYVAQSINDMKNKMIEFSKTVPRPFSLRYDPYTQSIRVLDSYNSMEKYAMDIQYEMGVLQNALKRQI